MVSLVASNLVFRVRAAPMCRQIVTTGATSRQLASLFFFTAILANYIPSKVLEPLLSRPVELGMGAARKICPNKSFELTTTRRC